MHFVEHLSVASALVSLAFGSPIEKRGVDFSVRQTVPKPFIKTGPAAVAAVYKKYGATAPADVLAAAAASNGTVSATPEEFDQEYLSPVSLGGQILNLDFDTGSSDLWCYSTQLPTALQSGHSVYDASESSTSKKLPGYTWGIMYGDGSEARGNVYADTVKVGAVSVTSQAVEAATSISASFQADTENDGLLGLAFDKLNTVQPVQQKTFFSNAKASLTSPLFTVDLKKGKPGTYDFGYIDRAKYTGAITYVNVNSDRGFWEFKSNGYAVGTAAFVSTTINAIGDTGTSLLYLPSTIVSAYYAKVSGAKYDSSQGGYTFPCSSTLPSLTLGIGSYKAVIPGSYILYALLSSTTCFGGLQRDTGLPGSIWGDVFLKSQFVVFYGGTTVRIGFAQKPT